MIHRSARMERMAAVYDAEILPLWTRRFGRMLLRHVDVPPRSTVLDVRCLTGYPTLDVLGRLDDESRIIALEAVPTLLDIAREKAADLSGRRIFFRGEPVSTSLRFADDVYALVLCNLGLADVDDPAAAVREFARVTRPGGTVAATLALEGTYAEFYDVYREVLTRNDEGEILERLDAHIAATPSGEEVAGWFEAAGLADVSVDVEDFRLLFKSGREFFFAPVIEYGPLSTWKKLAGKGERMQRVFWQIKEAIDAYFGDSAFEVTVRAGCVAGRKPEAGARDAAPPDGGAERTETVETPVPGAPPAATDGEPFLPEEEPAASAG